MNQLSVPELEQRIRDSINKARKQKALLNDSRSWNQLCSSLDVIGDTELAFDAYEQASAPDDPGSLYILVYGTLQALMLQQDSVQHLAEALGLTWTEDPLLLDIREIRNASVGHPTKRRPSKHFGDRSHFISRISMHKAGFQLLTVYPDGSRTSFREVSIPFLIATQRAQVRAVLGQVAGSLQREEGRA